MASKKNNSALKRERQSLKKKETNKSTVTALKTQIKKVRVAVESGDSQAAGNELTNAQSMLDKAALKGVIHRNKAARHKARLARKVSKTTAKAV